MIICCSLGVTVSPAWSKEKAKTKVTENRSTETKEKRGREAGELPFGIQQRSDKTGKLPAGLQKKKDDDGHLTRGLDNGGKKLKTNGKGKAGSKKSATVLAD
jgi:hypothetical protein